ncbi:hypothetical protein DICVIV_01175 [Dictyocaulus viviparus]|uniref:Uncharacterized protein n=1 Tax=Dictyocaulus viviparus TaxID=29172 RepID=A0A0D8Y779_DICVI|nr:hypothetical protein DICVIV_01175 [Dictyocaulus viviparus]
MHSCSAFIRSKYRQIRCYFLLRWRERHSTSTNSRTEDDEYQTTSNS